MNKKIEDLEDRNDADYQQAEGQIFYSGFKPTQSTLEDHLDNAGFEHICEYMEGDFHIHVSDECFELYHVHFHVRARNQQIIMVSQFKAAVPKNKRLTAAEFITRINNKSSFGDFGMIFDEGVVGYSIKTRCNAETLTFDRFTDMFEDTFFMMDVGYTGFAAICAEGKSAIEAFEISEQFMENKLKAA